MDEKQILDAVSKAFGMTVEILRSKKRTQYVAFVRQVAMYLIRENTDLSTIEIGDFLNRDHSTVIHGWNVIERRRRDLAFRWTVDRIGVYSKKNIPWGKRSDDERGCLA